jgi:hypothetical protein
MARYYFREVWTPLKLIGIRYYRDDEDNLWIKYWKRKRQLLSNK